MLRLLLPASVLILAASNVLQDCVDKSVSGNTHAEIQKFASKDGKLLFFPGEDFEGVTINFIYKNVFGHEEISVNITRQDLKINSSRWYGLRVTVTWGSGYYQRCKFITDFFSGTCGAVQDLAWDDLKSFSVVAHGASFWSLDTSRIPTQCDTPTGNHHILATHDPNSVASPSRRRGGEPLLVWLVGAGGTVVIMAAVVAAACLVRRATRLRRHDPREGLAAQQRQDDGPASGSPTPGPRDSVNISINSLYEPFCDFNGLAAQQRQDDGPASGSPTRGRRDSVNISINSLYEPFCAFNGLAEQQRQDDGPASCPSQGLSAE